MDQATLPTGGDSAGHLEIRTWQPEHAQSLWLKLAPGYLLAVAGLIWVLHGFHLGELGGQWRNLKWKFLVAALLCDMLSYFGQGLRWQLLLRPLGKIPVMRVTEALFAGLFINEVAPMRLGELARSYLVARRLNVRFASVFPTVLVERMFDAVWLALGISLTVLFIPFLKDSPVIRGVFGILVLFGAAALVCVILLNTQRAQTSLPRRSSPTGAWSKVRRFLVQMREDVRFIGFRRSFYLSFVVSLFTLLLQVLTFWLMLLSYGLALSFWTGAAILIIVLIGTAVPGPPGNLGSWQLSCVFGMTRFGVSKSLATGFSIVAFVLLTVPLLVIGSISLGRAGASAYGVRRLDAVLDCPSSGFGGESPRS